jgi:cyclopropane-fatty-acyl-phospholipid synthase
LALAKTGPLRSALAEALPERPFTVAFWDGTELPATARGPRMTVRSPRAVAHALYRPGQLGIGRAYVSGELEVDDLDTTIDVLQAWKPPPLDRGTKSRLALAAARAMGLERPPPRPESELVPEGRRHSIARDRRSVRHHYDLPAEFFALFLDASMTYSCAIFSRGATTLEEAQEIKLELVCTKLGLNAGERLLDVGCGWGSFAVHAAVNHGVHVTGITLSEPQAERARVRAEEAGVADRVDIRVQDWRELLGERFDAIASIGMVEHVGNVRIDAYAQRLRDLLEPDGRLLNHGIARVRHGDPEAGPFSERYVFPDAAPLHVGRVIGAFEHAGLPTDHIEGFQSDYAETLRHWAMRLDENLERATELAGPERVRIWRLYLRAARMGFTSGFTSIYQVRAAPPGVVLSPVGAESTTVSV